MPPLIRYSSNGVTKGLKERRIKSKTAQESLSSLRRLLQKSINEEIDDIMQKYIKQYLEPAAEIIEDNQRIGSAPIDGESIEESIKSICRAILEEAKQMY